MEPEIHWVRALMPDIRLALMPRPRAGDWLADEIAGWRRAGLGLVVSLLEAGEIRELGLNEEAALCEQAGIAFRSFPIPDRQVPASVRDTAVLAEELATRLKCGTAVGVHCRAGIGRTSLVAGCVLLQLGHEPGGIVPLLSQARGLKVPDTEEQAQWLHAFARMRPG
jgi:protein-tyrosine phosphatase